MGRLARILTYTALSIASCLVAFPVVWMLAMSVRTNMEIFALPPSLIPKQFILDAYRQVFQSPTYLRFFFNSYIVAMSVTSVSLVIAVFAVYGFSRFIFRGSRLMNLFIIGTQTIPSIVLLIPYFMAIVGLGLYDSYLGLIVTFTSFCLPYSILMMTGYFNTISKELDEAVMVDGGGRIFTLCRIILPVSVPGLVATGVYTFLMAWNEFLFALTLTKSIGMRTIPVGISFLIGEQAYQWNIIMSVAILGSVPVLLMFLLLQRYFVSGLTAGSVKG
jgi:multiple sugar transport system permease protein